MHTNFILFCLLLIRCWTVPPEVLKLKGRRGGELGQTECE
jgi:hypothetical protein